MLLLQLNQIISEMKRILSIAFTSIAVLLLIVFSAIPHHHHKEVVCLAMETCNTPEQNYNNEYTEHHHSDKSGNHESACVSSIQYVSSSKYEKNKTVQQDNENIFSIFSLLLAVIEPALYFSDSSTTETIYNEYIVSYQSATLGESSGLRAPPALLL